MGERSRWSDYCSEPESQSGNRYRYRKGNSDEQRLGTPVYDTAEARKWGIASVLLAGPIVATVPATPTARSTPLAST